MSNFFSCITNTMIWSNGHYLDQKTSRIAPNNPVSRNAQTSNADYTFLTTDFEVAIRAISCVL